MNDSTLAVKLPGDRQLSVQDLDTPFSQIVALCREALGDPKLTPENFGALKYFFFVNRSTNTLIEDNLIFMDVFTLRKIGAKYGQVLELCYVPNR